MKSLIKRERGFTLIEIVIVLAIAAALILVVFLAVSGAQKSKRDQVTKTNAGQLGAQLENYEGNNGGDAPAVNTAMGSSYLGNIVDGLGGQPKPTAAIPQTAAYGTAKEIIYSGFAICKVNNGPGGIVVTRGVAPNVINATKENYAVDYWSESAGTDVCVDNT